MGKSDRLLGRLQGLAQEGAGESDGKAVDPPAPRKSQPLVESRRALVESVEIDSDASPPLRLCFRARHQPASDLPAAPLGRDVKVADIEPAPVRDAIEAGDERAIFSQDDRQRTFVTRPETRCDLRAELLSDFARLGGVA